MFKTILMAGAPDLDGCRVFAVGGAVRDAVLGVESKDLDFAVECPDGFDGMREAVLAAGCEIFVESVEHLTLRAKPKKGKTFDFVLCRKDGPSSDGRRPDWVEPGTILDDLARRDFTMNAVAVDMATGMVVDPFGGVAAAEARVLDFVGDPMTRLREDGLRALRAVRFAVTRGFAVTPAVFAALADSETPGLLGGCSVERRREELHKAFKVDTLETLRLLGGLGDGFVEAVFAGGLWLEPTLKQ